MATKKRKRSAKPSALRRRGGSNSPAELFMAGLGLLLIILFLVIVVSSFFD